MDATAHPFWMPHALWGLALGAAAAALMIVAHDALTRRRLRFTLLITVAFLALHAALATVPSVAGSSNRNLLDSIEAMLLALAVTNTVVTLVFNPWMSRAGRDRAPSIVQDVLVVALIAGVAYYIFGERIVGPSIGAAAAVALRFAGSARESVRGSRDPDRAAVSRRALDFARDLRRPRHRGHVARDEDSDEGRQPRDRAEQHRRT